MAVGYIPDATQGVDEFDGKYFNDSEVALNTLLDNEEYVIQGRVFPFDASDVVPLVFKKTTDGSYTISIDHLEGIFSANQDILLVDNLTGVETDLKSSGYTFAAKAGIDIARFYLKYQKSLGINPQIIDENNVLVYKNKGAIHIKSGSTTIENIKIYDISGRHIFEKTNVNANETRIESAKFGKQILIVQIVLDDNKLIDKKVEN